MAYPVQVSLRIPGTSPMPELLRLTQDVEAAGFDGAGILDSQLLCRDTFVTLGQAATRTSRLTLFPAVTNPFSRHVSVLASAIQTVAELAPGRTKVRMGMAPTMAEARRMARPTVVHQGIMRVHSRWLEYTKLSIPHFEIPPAVWKIYPDLSHAQNWEEAIAATSFVPDEVIGQLCDALGLIGTPEHCAGRIADLTDAGVKSLYIMPLQTFVGPG